MLRWREDARTTAGFGTRTASSRAARCSRRSRSAPDICIPRALRALLRCAPRPTPCTPPAPASRRPPPRTTTPRPSNPSLRHARCSRRTEPAGPASARSQPPSRSPTSHAPPFPTAPNCDFAQNRERSKRPFTRTFRSRCPLVMCSYPSRQPSGPTSNKSFWQCSGCAKKPPERRVIGITW